MKTQMSEASPSNDVVMVDDQNDQKDEEEEDDDLDEAAQILPSTPTTPAHSQTIAVPEPSYQSSGSSIIDTKSNANGRSRSSSLAVDKIQAAIMSSSTAEPAAVNPFAHASSGSSSFALTTMHSSESHGQDSRSTKPNNKKVRPAIATKPTIDFKQCIFCKATPRDDGDLQGDDYVLACLCNFRSDSPFYAHRTCLNFQRTESICHLYECHRCSTPYLLRATHVLTHQRWRGWHLSRRACCRDCSCPMDQQIFLREMADGKLLMFAVLQLVILMVSAFVKWLDVNDRLGDTIGGWLHDENHQTSYHVYYACGVGLESIALLFGLLIECCLKRHACAMFCSESARRGFIRFRAPQDSLPPCQCTASCIIKIITAGIMAAFLMAQIDVFIGILLVSLFNQAIIQQALFRRWIAGETARLEVVSKIPQGAYSGLDDNHYDS